MAKILTDKELGEIIYKATHDPAIIDDGDSYEVFLEDLGDLIAEHFGGVRGGVDNGDTFDGDGYTIAFHVDEFVPSDGGIYKDYDTDVTWKDGVETEKGEKKITMIVKKITTGFVVQTFDTDLECCINQEFVAGDVVDWEDADGNTINADTSLYQPFDMVQNLHYPKPSKKE